MKVIREVLGPRKIARVDIETTPREAEILLNFFKTLEASNAVKALCEREKSPLNVRKIHDFGGKAVLAVLIPR